jgi:hypothetical protein
MLPSVIGLLLWTFASGAAVAQQPTAGRLYHASPRGRGRGLSTEYPMQIADFWRVAQPGDVLVLTDGVYTGASSMIQPPPGLSGRADQPITIRCANEGRVILDGQFRHQPVRLKDNDWFVLEGFNACRSGGDVISIQADHCTVRRVCAWDAGPANHMVFNVIDADHTLLEDCAGFGRARKVFQIYGGSTHTTYRRCWGRWEGCNVRGPKMTFSMAYQSYHTLVENCIATWDPIKVPRSYRLLDNYGKPLPGRVMSDYEVDQPYGLFSADRNDKNKEVHIRMRGCIAYLLPTEKPVSMPGAIFVPGPFSFVDIENCLSIVLGHDIPTLCLAFDPKRNTSSKPPNLTARGLTLLGEHKPTLHLWNVSNAVWYPPADAPPMGLLLKPADGFGATIWNRYVDGKLTDEPLWPWPMDHRISRALKQARYEPLSVTRTITNLLSHPPTTAPASQPAATQPGS